MNSCQHDVDVKFLNGHIISYCKKCGKILEQQNSSTQSTFESQTPWGFSNNGNSQILHD